MWDIISKILKKIIPDWMINIYHWKLALIGALVYGWPSRKLKVIGITGTKGKSTVVVLAGKVLEEKFTSPQPSPSKGEGEKANPSQPPFTKGGGKVGWISSLTINDGKSEKMNPFHMTMPGRFFIQKTLAQMVKNGCEYALVEVTSEGIKQHRHRFIKWAGAVFTNLAPEHLEAHGGFVNYRKMKEKLFAAAAKNENGLGVYNLDDENVGEFLKYEIKNKFGYFLNPPHPSFKKEGDASLYKREVGRDFVVSNINLSASGSEFEINGVKFRTNLLGEFNVQNCAAAAAVGVACGVKLEDASRALAKILAIPGRLEVIDEGQDFTVVVDLAHTPDSFEKVFGLFRELKNNNPTPPPLNLRGGAGGVIAEGSREEINSSGPRIIAVFGSAGGGRDKWKRPELGRIAAANCDNIIICNEDPYDESAEGICREIAAGCKVVRPEIILDRRQAIARALSLARQGDIVLVLGKGTEQMMVLGDKKYDWDDRKVVREELKKIISK